MTPVDRNQARRDVTGAHIRFTRHPGAAKYPGCLQVTSR